VSFEVRPYWQSGKANRFGVFETITHEWVEFPAGRVDGDAAWATRQVQALLANPALAVGRRVLVVPSINIAHIVTLQWNTVRENITGGHRRLSLPAIFTIGATTYNINVIAPSASDVAPYSGNIQLVTSGVMARNSFGDAIEKTSEMFPDSWSEADIEAAISDEFHDAHDVAGSQSAGSPKGGIIGTVFVGQARGIWIRGILSRNGGQISTAFPDL